jgi:hypothetical protein
VVALSMVFLASIILPAAVLAPERLTFDEGSAIGLSVFLGFEGGLLAIFLRRVDFFVEGPQLRMFSSRWPFATQTSTVTRAEVSAVSLEYRPRGRSVRLVLEMKDGSRVPVTRSFFGASAQTERDLTALRALVSGN